jgi:hypothetical protein
LREITGALGSAPFNREFAVFVSRRPFAALIRSVTGLALATSALSSAPVYAQGDLLVAPTRVVIDGRGGAEVILNNTGATEATYRITLELRRMNENGELEAVERQEANTTEEAAMEMIRYAPRRVTLPPAQPQAIRINARPSPDLPDGEYRVHMSFNAIPETERVEDADDALPAGGISIKLIPVYGITIPVIVRKGVLEATAGIGNPRIVQSEYGPQLELELSRQGEGSVFGEVRVVRPGESDPLYLARGIAVYPEIGGRKVLLPLSPQIAESIKGPLRFEYRELPENGGELLASVDATIG